MSTLPVQLEEDGDGAFPCPFGDYVLLQPLDRGGMGQVYLAKHSKVDGIEKFCVVKTLRTRFTADEDYVGRFVDEARIVVHLGHRNICQVFDVGKVGDRYYLAMELVSGRDLRRVLDATWSAEKRLPLELGLHITCQVLEALDYAHRHVHPTTGKSLGLVHRDVSPQNVMVNLEGEVKLIDFGLAATNLNKNEGDSGVVMGKLGYMSPEQLSGEPVNSKSDVYSAAIMAYEMLVGARFYEGITRDGIWDAALDGHRPARSHELPSALWTILQRALDRDVSTRLSCDAFLEELERFRHEHRHQAGARQLRTFLSELFPGGQQEARALLLKYATTEPLDRARDLEQSISIARSELRSASGPAHDLPVEVTASLTVTERSSSGGRVVETRADDPVEESAAETVRLVPERARTATSSSTRVAWILTGLFGVVIAALLILRSFEPTHDPNTTAATDRARAGVDVDVVPPTPPAPTPASATVEPERPPESDTPSAEPPRAVTTTPDAPKPPLTASPPRAAASAGLAAAVASEKATDDSAASDAPAAPVRAPTVDPHKRMTFSERIDFLASSCAAHACSAPLVEEFAGVNLPDVPTKRLAEAVAEIRGCVETCQAAR